MKQKKLTALLAVLAVSALGVGALSYYSGTAEKKQNDFNIVAGQKDQDGAGTIQEPAQDNGGKADAAAGLQPDQIVPKDPYIVSNVDWSVQAIMKVEVPKFTEDPNTGKPAAELLNVNADGKWKLLRELDDTEKHTVVYGYTEPLAGNNSTKPEAERAKTSNLFDSFKITGDISLANTYTGVIRVSGTLLQTEGHATVNGAAEGDGVIPKSYAITYDLGENAVLSGQKTRYSSDDYGYTPPEPTRNDFDFTGWTPASIADGSTDTVNFTANWTKAATATIQNGRMSSKIGYSTTAIRRVTEKPDAAILSEGNRISTDDSEKPVYMQMDGNVANWYSEAKHPYLQETKEYNCQPFSNRNSLNDISGLADFNTSKITDMSYWFSRDSKLNDLTALKDWNVSSVQNMEGMFQSCSSIKDISVLKNWNTENVTTMERMFYECSLLQNIDGLNNQNVSSVKSMEYMFYNCASIQSLNGLINQNTETVTTMANMFDGCSGLKNIDAISTFNFSGMADEYSSSLRNFITNVTIDNVNLSGIELLNLIGFNDSMFSSCTFKNFTMDNLNAPKLTTFGNSFFSNCTFDNISIKNWNIPLCTRAHLNCVAVDTLDASGWYAPKVNQFMMGGYKTMNLSNSTFGDIELQGSMFGLSAQTIDYLDLSNSTVMSDNFGGPVSARTVNFTNTTFPELTSLSVAFYGNAETVYLNNMKAPKLTNMETAFAGQSTKAVYMNGIQVPNVRTLKNCFSGCSNLETIDGLEDLDTSNVTTMYYMFANCNKMTDFSSMNNQDISKVTDFGNMCAGCSSHPEFTKRAGTWSGGTFIPST